MSETISVRITNLGTSLDEVVDRLGRDVNGDGVFVQTSRPLAPTTRVKFDLLLKDGSSVMSGSGLVVWRRTKPSEGDLPLGMGVQFLELEGSSRSLVDHIVLANRGRPCRYDDLSGAELSKTMAASEQSNGPESSTTSPVQPTEIIIDAEKEYPDFSDEADSDEKKVPLLARAPGGHSIDSVPPLYGEESQYRFKLAVDKFKADVPRTPRKVIIRRILLLALLAALIAFAVANHLEILDAFLRHILS